MNRRSFFRGAVALPTLLAGAMAMPAVASNTRITRVSMDPEDAIGHRNYAMCHGDGKIVKVYLDGVPQKWAKAADSVEGWVKRIARTPNGNMANDGQAALIETVRGDVSIVIEDGPSYRRYAKDEISAVRQVRAV